MEFNLYNSALLICSILTFLLTVKARSGGRGAVTQQSTDFKRFQLIYLVVYYVCMTADWLQGPYVYALYSSYGFSKHDIAVLFVGGFGASMVFGTFAGAAADKLGRKRLCQLYCVLYILSCVTKHARHYWILMLGRVLGGIATSLLFSSFESWMVCEHNARGYDSSSMSDTFSLMYFGNSLCAIGAGMMAEAAAEAKPLTPFTPMPNPIWHYGGYCSPFDLSAAFLFVGLFIMTALWGENYGSSDVSDLCKDFQTPVQQMKDDTSIPLAGTVISLFEGSMYIFVFNWTPALSAGSKTTPPFGLIFSIFMVACMGGSSLFAIAIKRISAGKLCVAWSSRCTPPRGPFLSPPASGQLPASCTISLAGLRCHRSDRTACSSLSAATLPHRAHTAGSPSCSSSPRSRSRCRSSPRASRRR